LAEQTTIAQAVSCRGTALHGGGDVRMTLEPASAGSGVTFFRGPVVGTEPGGPEAEAVRAEPAAVAGATHATTLSSGAFRVSTVEHLLATLHALEIDNVRVLLSRVPDESPDESALDPTRPPKTTKERGAQFEVPAMDGSAEPFVRLLEAAGTHRLSVRRRRFEVLERISVEEGERRISIEPSRGFGISCTIDFPHPAIGRQCFEVSRLTPRLFEEEIARARTFGFLEDAEAMRRRGLAHGASLSNTVVLDAEGVQNPEGLRWRDEFVRHKVLDLIGDLSLLGCGLDARVSVERGGHALHQRLVERLLASEGAWRVCEDEGTAEPTGLTEAGRSVATSGFAAAGAAAPRVLHQKS